MADRLPDAARVVIIGGGIIGCSIAYHLTRLGWRDVLLLERKRLTSGTTWHAAGLVRAMLPSANLTRLARYTTELYDTLEAETGQATGYRRNGSISIATNPERWEEFRRLASMARAFEVEVDEIGPDDVARLWPGLEVRDVIGAIHFPRDGQTNPADTCMALAKGARMAGARIVEETRVADVLVERGRAAGVVALARDGSRHRIRAEVVVNAAGMWAREVGRMAGVAVPLQACEHFYVVTEPTPLARPGLPVLRDMDGCAYWKEDAGKLLLGAFEPVAKPWAVDGIPDDFEFTELPEDWDHLQPVLEMAMRRLPALRSIGIRKFFNGPESFTPDQRYLLGEAPNLPGFFVAAGFNSIGIQSAGGAGRALAEWIAGEGPPFDLSEVDIRRAQPFQANRDYLVDRVSEALGLLYAMHWPYRQFETARGVRTSPLHDRLAAEGACFGEVAGWERANWFAAKGAEPRYAYSYGRQNWFERQADEHRAVREAAGLFDQSSFAKFRVEGPDALALLDRVSAAKIDVPVGRIVYTQWLNGRAGIEADLTVTRLAEDAFLVVTSAASAVRDRAWLDRHMEPGTRAVVTDVTAGLAVLGLMGPASREILQRVAEADLSNAAFPFGTSREIPLGYAAVRANRITYVGELGWELYVPADQARHVLERLLAAGRPLGLRLAGYHAMNSLRQEKGYRHWGHDISDEDTPWEAGLGFATRPDKPAPFVGQAALRAGRGRPTPRRLVQLALADPAPLLHHHEPIVADGRIVGFVTSGDYGHTLGTAVGMGYVRHEPGVDADFVRGARWEVEIAGRRWPARASLAPFYDPAGARVKG